MEKTEIDLFSILDQMELKVQRLLAKAELLVLEFNTQHIAGNKSEREKSFLFCKFRDRYESVYVEWNYNVWYGGKGGQKQQKHISKPKKNHHYALSKLLKHSAPWEHDAVKRTEEAFTQIRIQNTALAQARVALRKAVEAEAKLEEMVGDTFEAGE